MVAVVRVTAALLVVLVLQVELFSDTRLFGVMPELLLGASIAAAWTAGPERGAIVGFWAGLLYDLFLPTPLALTSITYVLIAFAVGTLSVGIADSGERALRWLVSVFGIAAGVALFVVLGELLGQEALYSDRFVTIIIVSSLYTAFLMPLLHRVMRWAFGAPEQRAPAPVRLSVVE